MQKWEYQVVGPIKDIFEGSYPMWAILTPQGQEISKIGDAPADITAGTVTEESQKLAAYIARLGDEGWEMVGSGATKSGHLLYFKRPKE